MEKRMNLDKLTNFTFLDKDKSGRLEENEVKAAHRFGAIWATEGQNKAEFDDARSEYYISEDIKSNLRKDLNLDKLF